MTDSEIRVAIYREFVDTGRAPAIAELAAKCGISVADMRDAFERLAAGRALALQPESREIMFAAPLSAVPTPYVVHAHGRSYFAPCIWDSFGAIAMLGSDAVIETSCPCCGEGMSVEVREGALLPSKGVVHFSIPAKQWWANIAFT
jgi:Alkylmercury lyase